MSTFLTHKLIKNYILSPCNISMTYKISLPYKIRIDFQSKTRQNGLKVRFSLMMMKKISRQTKSYVIFVINDYYPHR
jgi:hypothetical protein